MDNIEAHKRVALTLMDLSRKDREWFLRQLDADDREQVGVMLQELDIVGDPTAYEPSIANDVVRPMDAPAPESDVSTICDAEPLVLASALCDEPAWVIAALLVPCSASVSLREHVNQLSPEQIGTIRELMGKLRQNVKPKVLDVVVSSVAERIKRYRSAPVDVLGFDAMLERVRG